MDVSLGVNLDSIPFILDVDKTTYELSFVEDSIIISIFFSSFGNNEIEFCDKESEISGGGTCTWSLISIILQK